jgi:hypothetical protein
MRDEHPYLDSPDRRVRRWSVGAFSVASAASALAFAAWGGLDEVRDLDVLAAGWLLALAAGVWLVVAGIGLRLVRVSARRRSFADQPSER